MKNVVCSCVQLCAVVCSCVQLCASIVAEICMQATETTALTTTSHPPKVWERHVDDVFSVIRKSNYMTFLNTSTAFTPRPSSPWKLKKIPNSHSWTHSSRGIETTLFLSEKPIHTDQYLKFTSHHLARAKKSVITSLFDRAKNIISNPSDQEKEENHLKAVLQANGYPKKFIKNTIRALNYQDNW